MKILLLLSILISSTSTFARSSIIMSSSSLNNPGDSIELQQATERALGRTIEMCLHNKKPNELFKEMDNVQFEHVADDRGDVKGVNVTAKCIYKK